MKVQVTVELTLSDLPDEQARQEARSRLEWAGFEVARVAIVRGKGEGKTFIPKAGQPGSTIVRNGRSYQVWADGPHPRTLWVIPTERRKGDAPIYMDSNGYVTGYDLKGARWSPAAAA